MSDLTDAEVEAAFARQLRHVPTSRRHWWKEAAKATPGFLWNRLRCWSAAKAAMFMTGLSWPMFALLVVLDEWVKVFALLVVYIVLMAIFITFAVLESERPNGRAGLVEWTNERAGWGPRR